MTELDYLIEELWSAIDSEDQTMAEYFTRQIDDMLEPKE